MPNGVLEKTRLERIWLWVVFPLLVTVLFGAYLRCTQRYVGACDWYGYYKEAKLMETGAVTFTMDLPLSQFPAQVPLGFTAVGDRALAQYPPGFPFLVALFGFLGLEFYAAPILGLVSILFVFVILKDFTGKPWIASLFALAWGCSPIVVFGATSMMSDLVAATCVLGAFCFYRRKQLMVSALIMGLGFAVRPTNVMIMPAFALWLLRDRKLFRYGFCLAIPAAIYGVYNWRVYGAPWTTGYFDFRSDLQSSVFADYSVGYFLKTVIQFTPLIVGLALFSLAKPTAEKLCWAFGLLTFWLFYSFWRHGGSTWWWSRFLLPSYPGLILLAGLGFSDLIELFSRRLGELKTTRFVIPVAGCLMLISSVYMVVYTCKRDDTWKTDKGKDYYKVAMAVEQIATPGAYVGSVEFAGSIDVYCKKIKPFVSVIGGADQLANYVLAHGHDVYLIIEPWNKTNELIQSMLASHDIEKVKEFELWNGTPVYQLKSKKTK